MKTERLITKARRILAFALALIAIIGLAPIGLAAPASGGPETGEYVPVALMVAGDGFVEISDYGDLVNTIGTDAAIPADGAIKIRLVADITQSSATALKVNNKIQTLIIDGLQPNGKDYYTLADFQYSQINPANGEGLLYNGANLEKLVFQNLNINIGSIYGVFRRDIYSTKQLKISIDNCTINALKVIQAPRCGLTISNSKITNEKVGNLPVLEIARVGTVSLEGKVELNGAAAAKASANSLFVIDHTGANNGLMGIAPNAEVKANVRGRGAGFASVASGRASFTVGADAKLTVVGDYFQTNTSPALSFQRYTFDERSTSVLAIESIKEGAGKTKGVGIINNGISGKVVVNKGASLYAMLNSANDYDGDHAQSPIWLNKTALTLNSPKRVVFYTEGSKHAALGAYYRSGSSINFNGISYLAMYNDAERGMADFRFEDAYELGGNAYTTTSAPAEFYAMKGGDEGRLLDEAPWYSGFEKKMSDSFDVKSDVAGSSTTTSDNTASTTSTDPSSEYKDKNHADGTKDAMGQLIFRSDDATAKHVIEIRGNYSVPPTINIAFEGDRIISGTGGQQFSEILVRAIIDNNGTEKYFLTKTDAQGNWKVELPESCNLVKGTIIDAYQRESYNGVQWMDISDKVSTPVLSKTISLVPTNNLIKQYASDELKVAVSISGDDNVQLTRVRYIILNDPAELEGMTESQLKDYKLFGKEYSSRLVGVTTKALGTTATQDPKKSVGVSKMTDNGGGEYSGVIGNVQYNCGVWVEATYTVNGETLYAYDWISYKNLYTPVEIKVAGRAADSGKELYAYSSKYVTNANNSDGEEYGIPFMGDGETYLEDACGIDFVDIRKNIDANDFPEHEYWDVLAIGPEKVGMNWGAFHRLDLDSNFLDESLNTLHDEPSVYRYTLWYITNDAYRQAITEDFYFIEAEVDNDTGIGAKIPGTGLKDNEIGLNKEYIGTPLPIGGYVYIGYRLEDKDGNPIDTSGEIISGNINTITYVNGKSPESVSVEITKPIDGLRLVYLYRQMAAPITVTWEGETYIGNKITFGKKTKTGYLGEKLVVFESDVPVVGSWIKTGTEMQNENGSWSPATDESQLEFVLTGKAQNGRFTYSEKDLQSVITTIYKSDDKSLYLESTQVRPKTDPVFSIEALEVSGYKLTGWELKNDGGIISIGTITGPVYVDPLNGSQTLTFTYEFIFRTLIVKAVDVDDEETVLGEQEVENVEIGTHFLAHALAIEGYELADGEELKKTQQIVDYGNEIVFKYKKITDGTLILREGSEDNPGAIIQYQSISKAVGDKVAIPDLSYAYYTPVSKVEAEYKGESEAITYYYTKDMVDVLIRAIDEQTGEQKDTKTIKAAARKGEMYLAEAGFTIPNFALAEPNAKYVSALPETGNQIVVDFKYAEVKFGSVTISCITGDGDNVQVLQSYTVSAAVDSKFTAKAPIIEGYELADKTASPKEITVAEGESTIEFIYKDVRKTITVNSYIDGSDTPFKTKQHMVAVGSTLILDFPYYPGYVLKSYQIGDAEAKNVTKNSNITLKKIKTDTVITLIYVPVPKVIDDYTVNINIVAVTEDDLDGHSPLYKYTITRPNNSGNFSWWAQRLYEYGVKDVLVNDESVIGTGKWKAGELLLKVKTGDFDVKVIYQSLKRNVTIQMLDADDRQTPIKPEYTVPAIAYKPFSYTAPDVSENGVYYYLTGWESGELKGTTSTVAISDIPFNGETVISFYYKKVKTNAIIVAKEDDTDGRVIEIFEVESSDWITDQEITATIPDLSKDYFDFYSCPDDVTDNKDNTVTFKYKSDTHPQIIELYYKKQMVEIAIQAIENGTEKSLGDFAPQIARKGEVALVHAPPVDGYTLTSEEIVPVLATDDAVASFYYSETNTTSTITVTVIATGSNTPISGASVTLKNEDGEIGSGASDTNGQIRFTSLPNGNYTVVVKANGYNSTTITTTISYAGNNKELVVSLNKPSAVIPGGEVPSSGDTEKGEEAASTPALNRKNHIPYIFGYPDVSIMPEREITRAEAAIMIYRLLEKPSSAPNKGFTDIKMNSWYATAVNYLASVGILNGYPDGSFRPDNKITRAEFTTIISRFGKELSVDSDSFTDVATNHWAAGNINSAHLSGWVSGYPDGSFRPEQEIKRAEAVTIINAYLGRVPDKSFIDKSPDIARFIDLTPENHWAYYELMEAANGHKHSESSGTEIWIELE